MPFRVKKGKIGDLLNFDRLPSLEMIIANLALYPPSWLSIISYPKHTHGIIANYYSLSIKMYQDALSGAQVKVYKGHNSYVTCCHTDPNSARFDREFVGSE